MDLLLSPNKIGVFLKTAKAKAGELHGFTMIEVLVALAILSVALTSVYRLHSQTLMMSARARFYSTAPLLVQGKLAEIELQGLKEAADGSGDFGDSHPGYNWTVHVENMPSDLLKEKEYHLIRIEVTVTRNDEDHYNLRTYRYYAE